MIKEVVLENFKGCNSTLLFDNKTFIVGGNGAGKSTAIQGLCFGWRGHLPGEDERKKEVTFKASSGKKMSSNIKTENLDFIRSLEKKSKRNSDGSTEIKYQHKINLDGLTLKKAEEKIKETLGDFPFVLDFDKFLNLTDSNKRKFIFDLVKFDDSKYNKNFIKSILDQNCLENVEDEDYIEILKENINKTLDNFIENDLFVSLNAMNDYIRQSSTFWNQEKTKAQGAKEKLAEIKNSIKETDRNYNTTKKDIEDLEKSLIEHKTNNAADQEKIEFNNKRNNDIENKKEEIENHKKIGIADQEKIKNDSNIEIEELKKDLPTNESGSIINKINLDINTLSKEKEECFEKGTKLKAEIETKEKMLNDIIALNGTCFFDKKILCNNNFDNYKNDIKNEIKIQSKEKDELLTNYKKIVLKIKNLEEKREKETKKQNKFYENNKIYLNKIKTLELNINNAQNKIDNYNKTLTRLETELENLNKIVLKVVSSESEVLKKIIDSTEKTIKEKKEKLEEMEQSRVTLSNLQTSMIDFDIAEFNYLSFKRINEIFTKKIYNTILEKSLNPVQKKIQENFKLFNLNQYEFYFKITSEGKKEIFDFGWIKEKTEREYTTLSTGEKLMLLICMMKSFIEFADPPLKILILDNLDKLDRKNTNLIIEGLSKIDSFDNIIIAGIIEKEDLEKYDFHNFKVIEL